MHHETIQNQLSRRIYNKWMDAQIVNLINSTHGRNDGSELVNFRFKFGRYGEIKIF